MRYVLNHALLVLLSSFVFLLFASLAIEAQVERAPVPPLLDLILSTLRPTPGNCGLLLGFDTDVSKDADSYAQFYDYTSKQSTKPATNRTIFLTRIFGKVAVSAELDFIASPQKNGFIFLGQSRYFEPKPRVHNAYLSEFERPDSTTKLFGYDYTRIWRTTRISNVAAASRNTYDRTKSEIDLRFRRAKEKEWEQNITDYQKIGYVGNGFYVRDGFWSQITGGASFFNAVELSEIVSLTNVRVSENLDSWYSRKHIVEVFRSAFNKNHRNGKDAKYNDEDALWTEWKERLQGRFDETPTFTLERMKGQTHLIGRLLVPGNAERSFMATADFGNAPKKLITYDNPSLDFGALKQLYPGLIDYFVSPNQNTVFLLTDKELIGIDVESRSEIFRETHAIEFNKVVMVDWSVGGYVGRWARVLKNRGRPKTS